MGTHTKTVFEQWLLDGFWTQRSTNKNNDCKPKACIVEEGLHMQNSAIVTLHDKRFRSKMTLDRALFI